MNASLCITYFSGIIFYNIRNNSRKILNPLQILNFWIGPDFIWLQNRTDQLKTTQKTLFALLKWIGGAPLVVFIKKLLMQVCFLSESSSFIHLKRFWKTIKRVALSTIWFRTGEKAPTKKDLRTANLQ